ncbi:HipA domain-containing protein [Waltera sp.]|uniref:HipA domain-containing protein n=1 Tax=Waltera sp. TaxID=2815806 RepID=UPI003AB3EF78
MGMTLSMEEKVQTAAETVINASAADETVTGGTTPSEPLSEKRIVHAEDFDPLFAMSEEDCVEGFIKREMQRAGITEEQNLIPEDMLRRKNILNAILAVLLFVYISLFFFHFPMKTYVIGLLILVVYAFLTSRYQLIKYLKKEIRSRSQEKISNIVMNVKASMVPDYSKKLKWALIAVAVAGSLLLFSKPRIFYEHADDGYYVRFYVYGLTNMATATIPDTYQECEKLYRLMCFNVFAHNRDDHSKNFSYIYRDREKRWILSPAYDLTYSNSIGGEHATTVNGNGVDPGMEDLLSVAKKIGIGMAKARKTAAKIQECVHERLRDYLSDTEIEND